jgi:hypothetical protein
MDTQTQIELHEAIHLIALDLHAQSRWTEDGIDPKDIPAIVGELENAISNLRDVMLSLRSIAVEHGVEY